MNLCRNNFNNYQIAKTFEIHNYVIRMRDPVPDDDPEVMRRQARAIAELAAPEGNVVHEQLV